MLGSFHFRETKIDFFTDTAQSQIRAVAEKVCDFSPDAVAVECAREQQNALNRIYTTVSPDDFFNNEKMKNAVLGKLNVWGGTYDIIYRNEAIQFGFRVAKMRKHTMIYAIDDNLELPEIDQKYNRAKMQSLLQKLSSSDDNILERLKFYNSAEWSAYNQQLYMEINKIVTDDGRYLGVEHVSKWYLRNLKIFHHLQKLAENHKRIFIVYGAGHLKLLRDFISDCNEMILKDTNQLVFD